MNKFWPSNQQFHLGNPNMVIHTREFGDIPGCVPAPREGIYRPPTKAEASAETSVRAERWCAAVQGWIDGEDFGTTDIGQRWQAMWRASGMTVPICGAYGEKL